jgi:peptidoglycan-N-acetylglucosamine deacetylase
VTGSHISPIKIGRRLARQVIDFPGGLRRKYYGPITHVRTEANLVALTFDDGPHPLFTPDLLRILDRFSAKATFFMVGEKARQNPEIVKQVADGGHAIGNHSFSHARYTKLTSDARRRDIRECEAVLHPYMVKLFRPPFGQENALTHRDALQLGYHVVKWNLAPDDWRPHTPDWIAEYFLEQVAPGAIALLHDNVIDNPESDRAQTLDAVEKVLARASDRYQFCTVPQLLTAGLPMTTFDRI